MPRGKSETHDLAYWFWNVILEREGDPWKSPGFPRYLGEAKRARKHEYNIAVLKQACLAMKNGGIEIKSLLLPTLFSHHTNGPCWYEYIEEEMKKPPPVYDPHALRAWAEMNERQDVIDYLEEDLIAYGQ